jgi:hypothetical protein
VSAIHDKAALAAQLIREISDEIGATVRIAYRQPDQCIPEGRLTVTIEQYGIGLPAGCAIGCRDTGDKALDEALTILADYSMQRAA